MSVFSTPIFDIQMAFTTCNVKEITKQLMTNLLYLLDCIVIVLRVICTR